MTLEIPTDPGRKPVFVLEDAPPAEQAARSLFRRRCVF